MGPILLRVRRAALGLRQRDIADRAGISQSRYSLLERGEADATEKEKRNLESVLALPSGMAPGVVNSTVAAG